MTSLFKPALTLVVQYAGYHRDRKNILTHLVGIPLIFTAMGLFLVVPVQGELTLAWLMWALTSAWYLTRGDGVLGTVTAAVNGVWVALAHWLAHQAPAWGLAPWALALLVFVVGWVLQFVGHFWEGKKPAFVDDLVGLLVGPMFVVAEVLMAMGLLRAMHAEVTRQVGPVR